MKQIGHYAGQKFGRLTIISDTFVENGQYRVITACECGEAKVLRIHHILDGQTTSCGCFNAERATNHGMCGTPEHTTYVSMISRCKYPKNAGYKNYGGRGIVVDSRWLGKNGFANFFSDMGKRPSPEHSLDRYPDKNGNYTKENCRWATRKQQMENTRRNKWYVLDGEKILQKDLVERLGISLSQITHSFKMGRNIDEIIELYRRKNRLGLKSINSPVP